jgi:hypothetical protein
MYLSSMVSLSTVDWRAHCAEQDTVRSHAALWWRAARVKDIQGHSFLPLGNSCYDLPRFLILRTLLTKEVDFDK